MDTTKSERSESTKALLAQVELVDGVMVGPPSVLKALCAVLGFKNDCRDGRVYITPAKLRWLGVL